MQHGQNLPTLSKMPSNSFISKKENHIEVSIYVNGEMTSEGIANNVTKMKAAFPALPIPFYAMLIDRLKGNGFTSGRLEDAVNHVIDTCIYPTPTIANFINFDVNVKFYTYEQYSKLVDESKNASKFYKACVVKFTEVPLWAHVSDIEKYKLKLKSHEGNV